MGKIRLREAAKERWRKRKLAAVEASLQNKADDSNHSSVATENEPSKHLQSAALPSKRTKSKANNMAVRRSGRLLGSFGKSQVREAVHHIDLTNSTYRDGELHVEPNNPKPFNDMAHTEMEVDNLALTADGPKHSSLTTDNVPSKHPQTPAVSSKRKASKSNNITVRRSGRLESLGPSGKSQRREAVEHDDLIDCDRDSELHVEPVKSPKPIRDVTCSKMKSGCLVQNRGKRPYASETTETDLNDRLLCIDSEIKFKILVEENYRQAQEIHYLRGKVETYENMFGMLKDMAPFSNTGRTTGTATNLSRGANKFHRDAAAAALTSAAAPKPSPVNRKYTVKRKKKSN